MCYWAPPRLDRDQFKVFYPTLDDVIAEDHPVRLYDEILRGLDWSTWTARYDSRLG